MNSIRWTSVAVALVALATLASAAIADDGGWSSQTEFSLMGGVQALRANDTAVPDRFISIPAVAALTYHVSPTLAVEGEFTWMIPISQTVDLGSGAGQDMKTTDILAYQGNIRASWPHSSSVWTPYVTGGAGAVTFLSSTDPDRFPALSESQTTFALNFGAGASYHVSPGWAVRADFRELVALPSKDTAGLSNAGQADPIWMPRGTLGIARRF